MARVYVEIKNGKVTQAYTNAGIIEVVVVDHDQKIGYTIGAEHTPDLRAKDARAAAAKPRSRRKH